MATLIGANDLNKTSEYLYDHLHISQVLYLLDSNSIWYLRG